MTPSIFITYNSLSKREESTALRLQTIANMYGVNVEIPDRYGVGAATNTLQRIKRASYVIAFPLQSLSEEVKRDLDNAIASNKTIIVVFDSRNGRTVEFKDYKKVKEVPVDFVNQNVDEVLHQISDFIRKSHSQTTKTKPSSLTDSERGLLGLLAAGLGLLALAALADSKE